MTTSLLSKIQAILKCANSKTYSLWISLVLGNIFWIVLIISFFIFIGENIYDSSTLYLYGLMILGICILNFFAAYFSWLNEKIRTWIAIWFPIVILIWYFLWVKLFEACWWFFWCFDFALLLIYLWIPISCLFIGIYFWYVILRDCNEKFISWFIIFQIICVILAPFLSKLLANLWYYLV